MSIVQVALPIPKRQVFDYLYSGDCPLPGARVRVPFGNRSMIGIAIDSVESSSMQASKLKPITDVLDKDPVIDDFLFKICKWLSQYYHHPLGEVLQTALPVALRKGESSKPKPISFLRLTKTGSAFEPAELSKAKKQKLLLETLITETAESAIKQQFAGSVIKGLLDKGLIEVIERPVETNIEWKNQIIVGEKPRPNIEQSLAITGISQQSSGYHCFLLEGVTGSGKTEVYLQCIEDIIAQGKQILILVPEIGLTPQTVHRFKVRFGLDVGVLHSNLTDNERLAVWQQSRSGQLAIVIGTRSAIYTPMANLGMLIVDEEHDGSYKQQDGLRYNARDLAVMRAKEQSVPLILGSATPSLESLNNALSGRYQLFNLGDRAGNATHTKQNILDIKNQPLEYGLAKGMIERIGQHLEQGNQVMLFINRRGYAPALVCHQCGFVEECHRCNKPYTLHKQLNKIQCHHCGSAKAIPNRCGECSSTEISPIGLGTEQLEQGLNKLFPAYDSVRVDSDSARGKTRLQELLDKVNSNKYQLLIGTQILSKGHHFPNVTLVVILDADGALFSADFRAAEHLAQLITQLSGRAGRAEKPGEMWLQTHSPGHPLLQDLINNGYGHFARFALLERQQAGLPPHTFIALFRAEAPSPRTPHEFLTDVSRLFDGQQNVSIVGPIPALMEKRQGRFRMQLLLHCPNRATLQKVLAERMPLIEGFPLTRKVRWSIDVDPQDFL